MYEVKGFLRIAKWLVAVAVMVLIGAIVAVFVIDRHDRPPSAAAVAMAGLLRDCPRLADSANGYVYAMGFDAPQGKEPLKFGLDRIARYRKALSGADFVPIADPEQHTYNPSLDRDAVISRLFSICRTPNLACANALMVDRKPLTAWLSSNGWVLARYRRLLSFTKWRATLKADPRTPVAPYHEVFEGQRLLLVKAWLLAGRGDSAAVRRLLGADAHFWRGVLASTGRLIDKLIAVAALTRNFDFGNLALRRLAGVREGAAVPAAWSEAYSRQELSIAKVFAGEWALFSNTINSLKRSAASGATPLESHPLQRIIAGLHLRLFQPQATINLDAKLLRRLAHTVDVPPAEFPQALRHARVQAEQFQKSAELYLHPYNPVGNILARMGVATYLQYPARVRDLEGMRRAVLAAAQMRARGVGTAEVKSQLAKSRLRNPYNGRPFVWDAAHRSIVFVGLEPGSRGRHAFLY